MRLQADSPAQASPDHRLLQLVHQVNGPVRVAGTLEQALLHLCEIRQ
jgi:hypothetical protein